MKKYISLFFALFLSVGSILGQTSGNFFSAAIVPGSAANSVYVQIKSNITLSGVKFSSLQFALGIPTSTAPFPTGVTITSIIANVTYPPNQVDLATQSGTAFTIYSFSGDGNQALAAIGFTAGAAINAAEVFFTGVSSVPSGIRIIQIPNGGGSFNSNFYIADRGFDVTNQPAQFYATGTGTSTNDGNGYTGNSFATLSSGVVPVRLTTFNAVKNNQDAFVTWTVQNQDANADRFEVERSFNGTDFKYIGMTDANDNGGNLSYNYTDRNITSLKGVGIIYYRLKSVDKNGTFVYSQVRDIRLEAATFAINLYPNPAATFTNLSFELQEASKIAVIVRDAAGKAVRSMQVTGVKGINQQRIDVSSLATGRYNVTLQTNGQVQTLSFLKSN